MGLPNNATPRIYIDIYPFGGGKYSLDSSTASVLKCKVIKNISGNSPGKFSILMAPGGPQGTNSGPSWSEVIPPMSMVVIGMSRYTHRSIVMIGIVTSPETSELWTTGQSVTRTTTITGVDFQYFFNTFSYYTLSFLGATPGAALGSANGGLPAVIGDAINGGFGPGKVGEQWYTKIMAGTTGILSKTKINYQKGTVNFSDVMATVFQEYAASSSNPLTIPYSAYFLQSQGNWFSKFQSIFQFPFYEFFVITAPSGYKPYSATGALTQAKSVITMNPADGSGMLSASPTLVARMNPVPYCSSYNKSSSSYTMDKSKWDSELVNYTLENGGFINSQTSYTLSQVRNFFLLVPTFFATMNGVSNNEMGSFIYTFDCFSNTNSINSYGYRPEIVDTEYFSDVNGISAKTNATNKPNLQKLFENLTLKVATYYTPTNMMAYGSVEMELRPDIIPGNKFTYAPFKNGVDYVFYIEGFEHNYEFGGDTTTSLTLTRGLPKTVYDNIPLLTDVHTGNASRIDGVYASSPSAGALTFLNYGGNSIKETLARLAPIFEKA